MSPRAQIPPDGTAASFEFEIPAPEDLTTIGGVRLYFAFGLQRPDPGRFFPRLYLDGENVSLAEAATGPLSYTRIAQLPAALAAPVLARVTVNEDGSLEAGNSLVIYAWGAQTASGNGALSPDEGDQPSTMTPTIEVGEIDVLTWQEWNRLTGGNIGEADEDPGQVVGS